MPTRIKRDNSKWFYFRKKKIFILLSNLNLVINGDIIFNGPKNDIAINIWICKPGLRKPALQSRANDG